MSSLPALQEFHLTSGEYSVLLKVRVADSQELDRFLSERVKTARGVVRVRAEIVLQTRKETHTVPVSGKGS